MRVSAGCIGRIEAGAVFSSVQLEGSSVRCVDSSGVSVAQCSVQCVSVLHTGQPARLMLGTQCVLLAHWTQIMQDFIYCVRCVAHAERKLQKRAQKRQKTQQKEEEEQQQQQHEEEDQQHQHHWFDVSSFSSFYGFRDASTQAALLRIARPNHIVCPAEITGPFRKLSEALEAMQSSGSKDLQLWSREIGKAGAREFFLASYDEFWRHLRSLKRDERCFYECIRANVPVKLFLDIEFLYEHNVGVVGSACVEALLSMLLDFLLMRFQGVLDGNDLRASVLQLESPYVHKFSRHVIFRTVLFENVVALGHFMREFEDFCYSCGDDCRRDLVFVKSDKSSCVFLCDLGVYNNNRNFRCAYSSKAGKNSFLVELGDKTARKTNTENEHDDDEDDDLDENVFMDSLVCHLMRAGELVGTVVPFVATSVTDRRNSRPLSSSATIPASTFSDEFPAVRDYVNQIIAPSGGYIRCILRCANSLVFNIAGSFRYCANIGRHHKSNNVYFIISLHDRQMVQRCFDPDCRGFVSAPVSVPDSCFELTDDQLADFMEMFESAK